MEITYSATTIGLYDPKSGYKYSIQLDKIKQVSLKGDEVFLYHIDGSSISIKSSNVTTPLYSSPEELESAIKTAIYASKGIPDKIDTTSQSGITFLGFASPGTTNTSEPSWIIIRVDDSGALYPDGLLNNTHKWDDRLTLNYLIRKS